MNFLHSDLAIYIILFLASFTFFYFKISRKQEKFLSNTFFKAPTKLNFVRKILFISGLIFLGISLLDPRGQQEKIESNIPDQKTIIIIDSSASMLAEDVRPNRFKKSILMARHFIKKAFGHKVAVVLFSDIQKKLVPFTDDLDLLDARVAGLEELRIYDGGSNISQAIKESLGYFKAEGNSNDDVGGNVLVFTDSEGHDESLDLALPDDVNLAIVGVGTAKGARIPNRDRYGVFRGYKKFKSEEVVSQLNEEWLKSLSGKIKNYNYWIANSYTIPTEEILSFFNKFFAKKVNKGQAVVMPVKVEIFLLPAILLISLSFLLYLPPNFSLSLMLLFLSGVKTVRSSSDHESEMVEKLKEKMKEGKLNSKGKLKFAEILLRSKNAEAAKVLYEEQAKGMTAKDRNNYAVTLLQVKKPIEALREFSSIQKDANQGLVTLTDQERSDLRQNILLALQAKKQQEQQQKQKEKEEKEKKKEKNEKGEGKSKGDSGEKKDKSKGKEGNNEDKNKKEKGEGKDKPKEKTEGQKKDKAQSLKEKQDEIRKKRKMVKIPGLIKQIMSDDRDLQKKYLDTSTSEPKAYQKKDW